VAASVPVQFTLSCRQIPMAWAKQAYALGVVQFVQGRQSLT